MGATLWVSVCTIHVLQFCHCRIITWQMIGPVSGSYDEIYFYIENNIGEVREDFVRMAAGFLEWVLAMIRMQRNIIVLWKHYRGFYYCLCCA